MTSQDFQKIFYSKIIYNSVKGEKHPMSFYSGTKDMKRPYQVILDNYMAGLGPDRKKLPEKTTKHNMHYLMSVKNQIWNFNSLIGIEMMYIQLIRQHAQKQVHILRNIYSIMSAQKQTANFMGKLSDCLKTYMLYDKRIIDALEQEIDSIGTRYERNKKILTEWTDDFGLSRLTDCIRNDFDTDIFGHIATTAEEFDKNHNISEYGSRDDYFNAKNQYYADKMTSYAIQKGIDIKEIIQHAIEKDMERSRAVKKQIQNDRREQRQTKKEELAEQITMQDNAAIYNAIETANKNGYLGIPSYRSILSNLSAMGGEGYYICVIKQSRIYYAEKDCRLGHTLYRALWFGTDKKSQENMHRYTSRMQTQYADAVIMPQKIALPANVIRDKTCCNQKSGNITENLLLDDREFLMGIMQYKYDAMSKICFMLENLMIKNGSCIHYINAIKHDIQYTIMRIQNDGSVGEDIRNIKIFLSETDAKQYIHKNHTMYEKDGWTIVANQLSYDGPYMMHDTIPKKNIADTMNRMIKCMNMEDTDTENIEQAVLFHNKQQYKKFCSLVQTQKSIQIIVRRSSVKSAYTYFVKCVNQKEYTDIMHMQKSYRTETLARMTRFVQYLHDPVYAPSDNRNAVNALVSFMADIQEKYTDAYVFFRIEISYRNGHYTWKFA